MSEPSPIGRGELHVPGKDWLKTEELDAMGDERNLAQRHRHGKIWRDMDGNVVEPGWPAWVNWVALGVLILGVAGFMRGCA